MANMNVEIIGTRDVRRCAKIMKQIMRDGRPVAVDGEGVNLSAKGRMTLLQICTTDKQVILLDLIDPRDPDNVKPAKDLLVSGRVKAMLEAPSPLKVFHCCRSDSAALYHQFGIHLLAESVFDTQAADMAIQIEEEDVYFPPRKNLNHVAEKCDCELNTLKDEHADWMDENKEMWAQRPLTSNMISYAAQDVTVLIPDMYNALKRKLDKYSAYDYYTVLLDEYINSTIDKEKTRVFEEKDARDTQTTEAVLHKMAAERTPETELGELSRDETIALKLLQTRRVALRELLTSKTIEALDEKSCLQQLDQWGEEQANDPKAFKLPSHIFYRLKAMTEHSLNSVKQPALIIREIQKKNSRAKTSRQPRGGRDYHRRRYHHYR